MTDGHDNAPSDGLRGPAYLDRIGDLFLLRGLVTEESIRSVHQARPLTGRRFLQLIVDEGHVKEDVVARVLAAALGLEAVSVGSLEIHPKVIERIPYDVAVEYSVLPVAMKRTSSSDALVVVMADSLDSEAIDAIHEASGAQVRVLVGPLKEIEAAIDERYNGSRKPQPTAAPENARRVFVSWSDTPETPREAVASFVAALRECGLVVRIDLDDWPIVDSWTRWMQTEIESADVVIVLCSSRYRHYFEHSGKRHSGRGVAFEASLITLDLYESCGHNERFVPVLFPGTSPADIPTVLRAFRAFRLPHEQEALLGRLTGTASKRRRLTGAWPREPHPSYVDAENRSIGDELYMLLQERSRRRRSNGRDRSLDQRIIALKRQLREGPELQAGDVLGDGRYRLIQRIGHGGFGSVWRSYDVERRIEVAVKILHGQYSRDETRIERFFRGAMRMAGLDDPRVVRVHDDRCIEGSYHFFVMEFLAGGDLQCAGRNRVLTELQAIRVVREVAFGLHSAHVAGLIHRDVKPANILLTRDLYPKITDFDLVWAMDSTGGTRTGALGTYRYAAPEGLEDASRIDPRADQYSLALSLPGKLSASGYCYEPAGRASRAQRKPMCALGRSGS